MDPTVDARAAALFRIFEYTGALGNLPLPVAIATYRTLRASRNEWAVGPFAISVTQLDTFAANADEEAFGWPLAILLDYPDEEWLAGVRAGAAAADVFAARHGAKIRYYCTTMPEGNAARHALSAALAATGDMPVHFETSISDTSVMRAGVESIYSATDRAGPRVRITAAIDATTTNAAVALFLAEISAGPIRTRFTAQQPAAMTNGDTVGFLNLIAAYEFGTDLDLIQAILDERSADVVKLSTSGLSIGDTSVGVEALTHMRWSQMTSYATPTIDTALTQLVDIGVLLP